MTNLLMAGIAVLVQSAGGPPAWVEDAREVIRERRAFHAMSSRLDGDRGGYPEALAKAEEKLCTTAPNAVELGKQVMAGQFTAEAVSATILRCRGGDGALVARTVLESMPRTDKGIQRDAWHFVVRLPKSVLRDLWPLIEVRLREVRDWRTALEASLVLESAPSDTQGEVLGIYFLQAPSVSRRAFAAQALRSGPIGMAKFRATILQSGNMSAVEDLRIIEDG